MATYLKYKLFFIALCVSTSVFACSCAYIEKVSVQALLSDGIVFKGKIIDLQLTYTTYGNEAWVSEKIATFVVDSWYSSQEISDTIVVNTGGGGGDCGLFFNKGETWLMYAYDLHGIIQSSICTPSIAANSKSFSRSVRYLEKLKTKTGYLKEKLESSDGPYFISGNLRDGNPVGRWITVRDNDTIAISNFDLFGKPQGYQMSKIEYEDQVITCFYERTDTSVKIFDSNKELIEFYELRNGRRHGKYEKYSQNRIFLIANYKNGRLFGDWTLWDEDAALSKGMLRTEKVFSYGKLVSSIRIDEATGKRIE
jgi:hypothetical protein